MDAYDRLNYIRKLRSILRRLEWSGDPNGDSCCPMCGVYEVLGHHAENCDLYKALYEIDT